MANFGVNLGMFGPGAPNQYGNNANSPSWSPQAARSEVGNIASNIFGAAYGPQQAPAPRDDFPGGYSASNVSSSGSAGPSVNKALIGQYDQGINNTQSAINRLGAQQNSAASGIESSYQNALNQLLLGKNQGQESYNTSKQGVAKGYVAAKNSIGAQAGATLNGLLRLLGARGAGGGSAARIAAPQAVARGASLQRSDVGDTFGENNQSLDTNWNNYLTDYNNQVSGVGNQRDQARQNLEQTIATSKASLLQSLAQLTGQRASAAGGNATGAAQPYLDQANQISDQLANYKVAPINYQTQAYQAPNAASYTVNPNATPTFDRGSGSDYFSPYLQQLLGKKQQQQFA